LSGFRRALAALAAATFVLIGAPSAHASSALRVDYASSVDGDLGTLQVAAESGSAITAVEAHVISPTTHQEVAVVQPDDFELYDGTAADGVWRTKQPLDLPDPGAYQIDVDVTDADGDHVTRQDAGQLSYYVTAKFSGVTTDVTAIDTGHRDVTVEGTLNAFWPNRQTDPLAGRTVQIDVDYMDVTTATTDADGHFSASDHLDDAADIQAIFRPDGGTPSVLYGESDPVHVGVDQITTRIVTQVGSHDIDSGGSVTLTGTLEEQTDSGWAPLAGKDFGVLFGRTPTTPTWSAVTPPAPTVRSR
jgi:hypothetical protein